MILRFLIVVFFYVLNAHSSTEEIFSDIYKKGKWGQNQLNESGSGSGSLAKNAHEYLLFIQNFIREHHIQSVIDIGCGDFELNKNLDWNGIQYTGYDLVEVLIERNTQRYAGNNICFVLGDGFCADLPPSDLLICKDVLQHLPNEYVFRLKSKMQNFKYVVLVDDFKDATGSKNNFNQDIKPGNHRYLDISQKPFEMIPSYWIDYQGGLGRTKRISVFINDK